MASLGFVRVSGFGWTVVPVAPYVLEHVPARSPCIFLRPQSGGGRGAILTFEGGPPRVELLGATRQLVEVAEVVAGPEYKSWRIETNVFTSSWPEGFSLQSAEADGPSTFDLIGPDGVLIYVQGPFPGQPLPELEKMVAPGQRVVARGQVDEFDWVEFAYAHEGAPWIMRHILIPLRASSSALIITMQAPEAQRGLAITGAAELAESFGEYGEPG